MRSYAVFKAPRGAYRRGDAADDVGRGSPSAKPWRRWAGGGHMLPHKVTAKLTPGPRWKKTSLLKGS